MPKRIQRKRTKGWRKPEGAVYVGRPSKWGNPYPPGMPLGECGIGIIHESGLLERAKEDHLQPLTLEDSIMLYRLYIEGCIKHNGDYYDIERLRGEDLMCWCPLDQPSHVLQMQLQMGL